MKFSQQAVSAGIAAAAALAHSVSSLPWAQAAPLTPDGQSPSSPLIASSLSVATSDSSAHGLVSGLYRRVLEPVSATISAVGLGVAGAMGVKNLAEAHHRNRKAAQKFVEDGYKDEYARDKDKDTKRINHYEAHPSKNCYSVCGGQKTHSPADCSKKKFRSELSLYRRAIEYLFEDDDAWDESDLDEDEAVMDVDYAVEDALKKSPLSSQNPLRCGSLEAARKPRQKAPQKPRKRPTLPQRPYQKKTLERTSTTPKPYKGAPAKAAGASTTPAKAAATSEKAASAPAKKSWNPFNKKTAAAAATDASGASAKKSSSWNPFGKKEPNPDEIKHVKVGGGLINKFRTAEKMRTSAEKKIDAQVKAGGCAVVHNKINGQHGL